MAQTRERLRQPFVDGGPYGDSLWECVLPRFFACPGGGSEKGERRVGAVGNLGVLNRVESAG